MLIDGISDSSSSSESLMSRLTFDTLLVTDGYFPLPRRSHVESLIEDWMLLEDADADADARGQNLSFSAWRIANTLCTCRASNHAPDFLLLPSLHIAGKCSPAKPLAALMLPF